LQRPYSSALVAVMKPFMKMAQNQAGYEDFNQVLEKRVEGIRDADERYLSIIGPLCVMSARHLPLNTAPTAATPADVRELEARRD
jgi:hypothetical protein